MASPSSRLNYTYNVGSRWLGGTSFSQTLHNNHCIHAKRHQNALSCLVNFVAFDTILVAANYVVVVEVRVQWGGCTCENSRKRLQIRACCNCKSGWCTTQCTTCARLNNCSFTFRSVPPPICTAESERSSIWLGLNLVHLVALSSLRVCANH